MDTVESEVKTSDGVRLSFWMCKEKPIKKEWLVLLHGGSGDSKGWVDMAGEFRKLGYGLVGIDLRGHGVSEKPVNLVDYKMNRLVMDLDEVLLELKLDKVVLVGHCLGGAVALEYARLYPEKIEGLVVIGAPCKTPFMPDWWAKSGLVRRLVERLGKLMPASDRRKKRRLVAENTKQRDFDIRRLIPDLASVSLKVYLLVTRNLMEFDSSEGLSKIKTPTLIIHGDRDVIVSVEDARLIHKQIKGSSLKVVQGGNHILVMNQVERLVEWVDEFVRGLR